MGSLRSLHDQSVLKIFAGRLDTSTRLDIAPGDGHASLAHVAVCSEMHLKIGSFVLI